MTLKECYALLGVSQSAGLEEVKRGYRKRAFEWHPDLNPQLGDAGRRFQQLNEAYVILSKLIAAREARDEKLRNERDAKTAGAARTARPSGSGAGPNAGSGAGSEAASAADGGNATSSKDSEPGAEQRREDAHTAQQAEAGHKGRASHADRTDKTGKTGKTSEGGGHARPADDAAKATDQRDTTREETPQDDSARGPRSAADSAGEKVYAEQQEVLRDILNDPFARRVFEDIYSAIRQKGHDAAHKSAHTETSAESESAPKSFMGFGGNKPQASGSAAGKPVDKPGEHFWGSVLGLGQGRAGFDLSKGVGGAVKGWLRGQIDEEQTFSFPATKLFPGARLRLQIRRGLSDEVTVLDVTLPPDFTPGKPIRLKGMGKRVGSWQGDLYLTLLAR